jgi:hypothetical protein
MPAIRRQGRRFFYSGVAELLRWFGCSSAASAYAWALCFAPSGDLLWQTTQRRQKSCPGHPVFRLGEKYPR